MAHRAMRKSKMCDNVRSDSGKRYAAEQTAAYCRKLLQTATE